MKKLLFILLIFVIGCSVDDDGNSTQPSAGWSLINIKGGVNNTDTDLSSDQIVWIFDEGNGTLIVENNIGGIPTGIDEGTHTFYLETSENITFLFIDNEEYGAISVGNNILTIDQNTTITGTASDKYELLFVR